MPRTGALACLEMKMIGKPYVENYKYGFDEGSRPTFHVILNGHEAENGGYSQGLT